MHIATGESAAGLRLVILTLFVSTALSMPARAGNSAREFGAHVDFTLMPRLRQHLREADWQRDRYLWVRAGYVVVTSPDSRGSVPSSVAVYSRLRDACRSPTSSGW